MLSINCDWEDFPAVSGGSASCPFNKTQGMGVALSAPSVEAGSKRVLEFNDHVVCGYILDQQRTLGNSFSDEVVPVFDMFCLVVEDGVFSECNRPLVIGVEHWCDLDTKIRLRRTRRCRESKLVPKPDLAERRQPQEREAQRKYRKNSTRNGKDRYSGDLSYENVFPDQQLQPIWRDFLHNANAAVSGVRPGTSQPMRTCSSQMPTPAPLASNSEQFDLSFTETELLHNLKACESVGVTAPGILSNYHLPEILLDHGPLAIRHIMEHLNTSVPGFSRLSSDQASQLVVIALEFHGNHLNTLFPEFSRISSAETRRHWEAVLKGYRIGLKGGINSDDVIFDKVGWGRWDARIKGQPTRERANVTPLQSLPSTFSHLHSSTSGSDHYRSSIPTEGHKFTNSTHQQDCMHLAHHINQITSSDPSAVGSSCGDLADQLEAHGLVCIQSIPRVVLYLYCARLVGLYTTWKSTVRFLLLRYQSKPLDLTIFIDVIPLLFSQPDRQMLSSPDTAPYPPPPRVSKTYRHLNLSFPSMARRLPSPRVTDTIHHPSHRRVAYAVFTTWTQIMTLMKAEASVGVPGCVTHFISANAVPEKGPMFFLRKVTQGEAFLL